MKRDTTIIAVVSGKGGVGKSIVAVNLAESLSAEGRRVALVDADLGQAACSILMNETPKATVVDLLRFTARTDQVKHETSAGITLIQASDEPRELGGRAKDLYLSLDELLNDLRADHEYVIIDAPAGVDGAVRWALDRADLGLLVVVGEPTAVADAYRLVRMIWKSDPAYPFGVVVNFATTADEARGVADRFAKITDHFTGRLPNYLGWVPFSQTVRQSVARQIPAVRQSGPAADAFRELARIIVSGRLTLVESLDAR